jgi:uncharacterized membrane protein
MGGLCSRDAGGEDLAARPGGAATAAAAAKPALYASRFNTMFSIGMLYCMVAQQNAPI